LTQRIRSFLPRSLTRIKLKKKHSSVDDVNDNNETVVVHNVPPTTSSEQLAVLLENPITSLVTPKSTPKERATSSEHLKASVVKPTALSQQPTTSTASLELPTASSELPTTSSEQPKALFEQVTTSSASSGQLTATTLTQQLQPLGACKQRVDRIENSLASLCFAICSLEERVNEMQREEEIEDRMWRYTLELILIKYSLNNKSKDDVSRSGDMQIEDSKEDNLQGDGSEISQGDSQETDNQED